MSDRQAQAEVWIERAAERSPAVQRSRTRTIAQAQQIVDAAKRLLETQGGAFTTQQLVKEAGVALQTFYRSFPGKDELLLAVLEDLVAEGAREMARAAEGLSDPLERLRFFITRPIELLETNPAANRVITAERWRLHQLFPEEVARTTRHFSDLLEPEIVAGARQGRLRPTDPPRDAWLITKMVMAVNHHYAYVGLGDGADVVSEHLWHFCLAALGGQDDPPPPGRPGTLKEAPWHTD
jgi:TetR/AcrR family transcriptional regulator